MQTKQKYLGVVLVFATGQQKCSFVGWHFSSQVTVDFSAGCWLRVTLSKSEMLMGSSPENPLEWWILHLFVLEPPDCFSWILFCKHILVILRASSHLLNKRTKKSQTKILNMRSNVQARLWVMSVNKFGTNEFCLMITLELERNIKMQAYRPNKRANYPLMFFNLYLSVWVHVYGTCINVHVWYDCGGHKKNLKICSLLLSCRFQGWDSGRLGGKHLCSLSNPIVPKEISLPDRYFMFLLHVFNSYRERLFQISNTSPWMLMSVLVYKIDSA